MSKEYVTLSREKLEELIKEAATDVYKMGLNDGINLAFEQMGEKISAMAVNFPNPWFASLCRNLPTLCLILRTTTHERELYTSAFQV